jgi:hypothetical protein
MPTKLVASQLKYKPIAYRLLKNQTGRPSGSPSASAGPSQIGVGKSWFRTINLRVRRILDLLVRRDFTPALGVIGGDSRVSYITADSSVVHALVFRDTFFLLHFTALPWHQAEFAKR